MSQASFNECEECCGILVCSCGTHEPVDRRERIAVALLVGIAAQQGRNSLLLERAVRQALATADYLIAALDDPTPAETTPPAEGGQ